MRTRSMKPLTLTRHYRLAWIAASPPSPRTFTMRLKPILSPLIVSLMLTGCAHSTPPLQRQIPPLGSSLAQPCPRIGSPVSADYDAWQEWVQSEVLKNYATCAARHAATVRA